MKARLIQTLVWPIVSYGAESWMLKQATRENIETFQKRGAAAELLRVFYVEHVSNVEIIDRIGQEHQLLNRIKLRKLRYFAHIAVTRP